MLLVVGRFMLIVSFGEKRVTFILCKHDSFNLVIRFFAFWGYISLRSGENKVSNTPRASFSNTNHTSDIVLQYVTHLRQRPPLLLCQFSWLEGKPYNLFLITLPHITTSSMYCLLKHLVSFQSSPLSLPRIACRDNIFYNTFSNSFITICPLPHPTVSSI